MNKQIASLIRKAAIVAATVIVMKCRLDQSLIPAIAALILGAGSIVWGLIEARDHGLIRNMMLDFGIDPDADPRGAAVGRPYVPPTLLATDTFRGVPGADAATISNLKSQISNLPPVATAWGPASSAPVQTGSNSSSSLAAVGSSAPANVQSLENPK